MDKFIPLITWVVFPSPNKSPKDPYFGPLVSLLKNISQVILWSRCELKPPRSWSWATRRQNNNVVPRLHDLFFGTKKGFCRKKRWKSKFWMAEMTIWLVVSTHLKNISQIGSLSQVGVKIKNIWNHHLAMNCILLLQLMVFSIVVLEMDFFLLHLLLHNETNWEMNFLQRSYELQWD